MCTYCTNGSVLSMNPAASVKSEMLCTVTCSVITSPSIRMPLDLLDLLCCSEAPLCSTVVTVKRLLSLSGQHSSWTRMVDYSHAARLQTMLPRPSGKAWQTGQRRIFQTTIKFMEGWYLDGKKSKFRSFLGF